MRITKHHSKVHAKFQDRISTSTEESLIPKQLSSIHGGAKATLTRIYEKLSADQTIRARILKLYTFITYNMRNIYAKFQNSSSTQFGEHQL